MSAVAPFSPAHSLLNTPANSAHFDAPAGFSSNAHVSLVAVSDLLRAFQPLVVGVLGAQQSAHGSVAADVTEWLKEFVRCSAFHGLRVQQKDSPVKCPWEALLCLEAVRLPH